MNHGCTSNSTEWKEAPCGSHFWCESIHIVLEPAKQSCTRFKNSRRPHTQENIDGQSSSFTDSAFADSPFAKNVFVTPKPILEVLRQSFTATCRAAKITCEARALLRRNRPDRPSWTEAAGGAVRHRELQLHGQVQAGLNPNPGPW